MAKLLLKEVAILLVARFDSIQRLENALIVSELLCEKINANVYLWEFDSYNTGLYERLKPQNVSYKFITDDDPIFHRTRHLNEMIEQVDKKYVAIWDIDVIAPINQIYHSVKFLEDGADFVYPYNHFFLDTSEELRYEFIRTKDISLLEQHKIFMNELYPPNPVGGAFFANTFSYIKCGKENEQFYGWGIEDGERYSRWICNKMNIKRVDGPLFHLSHPRGSNSNTFNEEDSLIKHRIRLSTNSK